MNRSNALARTLALAALASLLAACGGGADTSSPAAPAPAPTPTPPPPPPPPVAQRTVRVQVDTTMAAGESFQFTLGTQSASVSGTATPVAFAATLAEGSAYTVSQAGGPRNCTLSANRTGTIASADVLVTASCGAPAATQPLAGELRGPVGTQVTVRNNGADSQAVTIAPFPNSAEVYNAQRFTFATPLADGSAYAVTLANVAASQTCSVYKGANGTTPIGADALQVGCEWNHDHLSRSTTGALGTSFESWKPTVGGNAYYGEGRFVAFSSSATGLSPNGHRQVFWRDRMAGVTYLISTDANGAAGNANSDRAQISADGLTVVFESYASNLVAGDTNGVRDVFRWSAASGAVSTGVTRVSVSSAGAQANGHSHTARVSADGSIVAFTTDAANLVNGASGTNIIRRDMQTGVNTIVSANGSGAAVGGERASISADGNRIAFWSFASDITAGDNNGLWDIFVYQHDTGTRRRISLRADGGERNQGTDSTSGVQQPVISGNGRFVVYPTSSSNVVSGDTNGAIDLFLVDLDGSEGVTRISVASNGAQGNADSGTGSYWDYTTMSHDGSWIAFASRATNLGTTASSGLNLFLRNRSTGQVRALTDSTVDVGEVSLTPSANYIAFSSGLQLDPRFTSTGLFAHFTGLGRAFFWAD